MSKDNRLIFLKWGILLFGDKMKKKLNLIFKVTAVSLMAGVMFFAVGYSYLTVTQKEDVTDNSVSSVPYYSVPENAGVMFEIGSRKTFIYLDFEEENASVIFADDLKNYNDEIYGYCVDYRIKTDDELLAGIIDILGGIDIEFENETLNCTGIQVLELIQTENDTATFRRKVTEKIIERIGEKGMMGEDFLYIIENSKTNLTLPDCYFWAEHIANLCKRVRYVN